MMSATLQAAPSSRLGVMSLLFRRHFSPFKTYIRRDLGLAVLLNPKVGSTAFRKILVEGLKQAGERPVLGRFWPLKLERRYLTAPLSHYFDALLHPNRYQFYCFVRNPYARLLSSWKDKVAFGHADNSFPKGVKYLIPELRRFAMQHALPGSEPASEIPFATFIAFVRSQPEGTRNHHWDTQRSVLFTDTIRYERIFRMETEFASGMTEILTRLGLPKDWIVEKLKAPHNPSRKLPQPAYTKQLAAEVQAIYSSDFQQFNYDLDSWQGM